jgi:hypothetical protein
LLDSSFQQQAFIPLLLGSRTDSGLISQLVTAIAHNVEAEIEVEVEVCDRRPDDQFVLMSGTPLELVNRF